MNYKINSKGSLFQQIGIWSLLCIRCCSSTRDRALSNKDMVPIPRSIHSSLVHSLEESRSNKGHQSISRITNHFYLYVYTLQGLSPNTEVSTYKIIKCIMAERTGVCNFYFSGGTLWNKEVWGKFIWKETKNKEYNSMCGTLVLWLSPTQFRGKIDKRIILLHWTTKSSKVLGNSFLYFTACSYMQVGRSHARTS